MLCDFWQVQEHKSLWIYSWCINLKSPNKCVCKQSPVYSPVCIYHPCCCVLSICACTFSSYHHAPARSQDERAVLCLTSRLSDASAWPGAASAVGRHINKLSVTVKTSHALKITLSTARLDITLESSSLACLQEVWPTNILMRTDLIMVKEGLDWWIETRGVLQGVHQ